MAAVATQGTDAYILVPTELDPAKYEVIDLGCVTSIDPGADTSDQIETTCLKDSARTYIAGLTTPGQGSIGLNADPKAAAHLRLFELSKTKGTIKFAIGWADGTVPPTVAVDASEFTLPTTRTWYTFDGYVSGFPFNFGANSVVQSTVSIQRSGEAFWIPKA